jgi:hypothetical protein
MEFAKLSVKTSSGWRVRYYKYDEPWVFGKFLCRYYKGKEYEWEQIDSGAAALLSRAYSKNFKHIPA